MIETRLTLVSILVEEWRFGKEGAGSIKKTGELGALSARAP